MMHSGRSNLFKSDAEDPDDSVTIDGVLNQLVTWGTPSKVADELQAFRDQIGDFGTLLYAGHDWQDRALAERSMELMATKVLPALGSRRHAEARAV